MIKTFNILSSCVKRKLLMVIEQEVSILMKMLKNNAKRQLLTSDTDSELVKSPEMKFQEENSHN